MGDNSKAGDNREAQRTAAASAVPQERHKCSCNRNVASFVRCMAPLKEKRRRGSPRAHDHHAVMAPLCPRKGLPISLVPRAPFASVGPLVPFILVILVKSEQADDTHLADGVFLKSEDVNLSPLQQPPELLEPPRHHLCSKLPPEPAPNLRQGQGGKSQKGPESS